VSLTVIVCVLGLVIPLVARLIVWWKRARPSVPLWVQHAKARALAHRSRYMGPMLSTRSTSHASDTIRGGMDGNAADDDAIALSSNQAPKQPAAVKRIELQAPAKPMAVEDHAKSAGFPIQLQSWAAPLDNSTKGDSLLKGGSESEPDPEGASTWRDAEGYGYYDVGDAELLTEGGSEGEPNEAIIGPSSGPDSTPNGSLQQQLCIVYGVQRSFVLAEETKQHFDLEWSEWPREEVWRSHGTRRDTSSDHGRLRETGAAS